MGSTESHMYAKKLLILVQKGSVTWLEYEWMTGEMIDGKNLEQNE